MLSTDFTNETWIAKVPLSLEVSNFSSDSKSTHRSESEAPFKIRCISVINEYHVTATYRAKFKGWMATGILKLKENGKVYIIEVEIQH